MVSSLSTCSAPPASFPFPKFANRASVPRARERAGRRVNTSSDLALFRVLSSSSSSSSSSFHAGRYHVRMSRSREKEEERKNRGNKSLAMLKLNSVIA